MNNFEIQAQYEAKQVNGRSEFCPRVGYFKILATYQGVCLGKPALMAKANWKLEKNDVYTSDIFEVQLESIKRNADDEEKSMLDSPSLIGREFQVTTITYQIETQKFLISWHFNEANLSARQLNDMTELNAFKIDLDKLEDDFDDFTDCESYEEEY